MEDFPFAGERRCFHAPPQRAPSTIRGVLRPGFHTGGVTNACPLSPESARCSVGAAAGMGKCPCSPGRTVVDRKSTRLNSSHVKISYAVFCLKKIHGRLG